MAQMLIRRERWPGGYRVRGIPLVYPGQEVQPDQPVIRLEKADTGAEASEISQLPRFSLPTVPVTGVMPGDPSSSQRMSELIPAGLLGRVVDITPRGGVVIESRAVVVRGAMGAGNQVAGILTVWGIGTQARWGEQQIPPGAILVIPGPLNFAMLRQAMSSGMAAVVASSISSRDLEGFLRTDLVSLIDSIDIELAQAQLPPMTLMLTEGLGTLAMPVPTINLLSKYSGFIALISGVTSPRQGIYPELIISVPPQEAPQGRHPVQADRALVLGAQVRVVSGSHEGAIGQIDYLFTHQQVFSSGVRARAARLRLEDGSSLVAPLTLIERIE